MRLVLGELKVADVRSAVALNTFTDFENFSTFAPAPGHDRVLDSMLSQVVAWSTALAPVRAAS